MMSWLTLQHSSNVRSLTTAKRRFSGGVKFTHVGVWRLMELWDGIADFSAWAKISIFLWFVGILGNDAEPGFHLPGHLPPHLPGLHVWSWSWWTGSRRGENTMFICHVMVISTPCSVAIASVLHSFVNIKYLPGKGRGYDHWVAGYLLMWNLYGGNTHRSS